MLWCSGYHICLTRRRSPVRNRAAPCPFFPLVLISSKVSTIQPLNLALVDVGSRGVVVITCASHAQGPRFDPGQEQILSLPITHCRNHLLLYLTPTKTVPPIIANLPRVCIVVCINFISSLLKFSPSSSTTGTASTVIASATTS